MCHLSHHFDVIVVGGGHAGCEAAYVSAKMGASTLLLSMNLDTLAKASCNPSIGGTAKGHIVREIDALGGMMGKVADRATIHSRMLHASKGPAIQSPRVQIDKHVYHHQMKLMLEETDCLFLKQGTVEELIIEHNQCIGVILQEGVRYFAKSIVLTTGTFMSGTIFMGNAKIPGGRLGDPPSISLSKNLQNLGISIGKLKTGTPARIHKRSIDFSVMEEQPSEEPFFFSFDEKNAPLPKTSCYITYTTERTQQIIEQNKMKSARFGGQISGVGPRYCPSIEDKIFRFPDKARHQLFLEPEGLDTQEYYINGLSTSMPVDVQQEIIHSVLGLEKAEIMRPAYAIEYDFVESFQISATLESKKIENLYFAGQINGTTGYEEAAAQGLIAAINAVLKISNKEPFILSRSESYIGVLIDDLITKEHHEPYRMFTSRAEHRLLLRHSNADLRLRKYGYTLGLITKDQMMSTNELQKTLGKEVQHLNSTFVLYENKKLPLAKILARPEITYSSLLDLFSEHMHDYSSRLNREIEIEIKYSGYLERQHKEVKKLVHLEKILIPQDLCYDSIIGLCNEAKEKLKKCAPHNLSTAAAIAGISPADIFLLMVALKRHSSRIQTG
ncbi:MAG: tRNA uridine-5-carboxymethylaminomethyl(34) synthesis enzyme MnmG [Parachlamydiales bacterium]|nr:tRNA uridine-5-carboxymethylaminomethyl(34) synthesis enzyme MnmG [Parachlamydiales bacterium]